MWKTITVRKSAKKKSRQNACNVWGITMWGQQCLRRIKDLKVTMSARGKRAGKNICTYINYYRAFISTL